MTSMSLLSLRFRFWTCFLNFRAAAAVVDVVAVGGVVVDLLVYVIVSFILYMVVFDSLVSSLLDFGALERILSS